MQGVFILKWEIEKLKIIFMTSLIPYISITYVSLLSRFENVYVFETSFFESLFWLFKLNILAFVA